MQYNKILILAIILISFVVATSFYFSDVLPDKLASHWDANGDVNGYMSKFWGLFLMPIITLFLGLLFWFLPKIDPHKENYKLFQDYYDGFVIMMLLFFLYIYMLTVFWNLGFIFDMMIFIIPAFCVLFYFVGILVSKAKRNWFVGIRTPWTLSNDIVWNKTHKLGGLLFKLCAIISLFGMLFKDFAFYIIISSVVIVTLITLIYSYIIFRKESKASFL